jgi:hypothetical protein
MAESGEGARSQKDVSARLARADAEAEAEAWRARFVNFCHLTPGHEGCVDLWTV